MELGNGNGESRNWEDGTGGMELVRMELRSAGTRGGGAGEDGDGKDGTGSDGIGEAEMETMEPTQLIQLPVASGSMNGFSLMWNLLLWLSWSKNIINPLLCPKGPPGSGGLKGEAGEMGPQVSVELGGAGETRLEQPVLPERLLGSRDSVTPCQLGAGGCGNSCLAWKCPSKCLSAGSGCGLKPAV